MNLNELAQRIWAQLNELAITPVAEFYGGLDQGDRTVLYILLAIAVGLGFVFGSPRLFAVSDGVSGGSKTPERRWCRGY